MSEIDNNQPCHLDEVRDVHPILRANTFLIEEGLKLVRGEKYLSSEELKHIDLLFEDKNNTPTFVEIKWSDVSESQMCEYRRLVDQYHPQSRLIWAVPQDLIRKSSAASKYGIEVKSIDRKKIIQIKGLQNKADEYLNQITSLLSLPFKVTMHGEIISFENPIIACYFAGYATTDRGSKKKVGLKQQTVGRQLDLIKNLTIGHAADLHKEKVLLLIWEIFKAPYSYKRRKFWRIIDEGFIELIKERQERNLEKLVTKIWELVNQYYNEFATTIKTMYSMDIKKYDPLSMLLFQLAGEKKKVVFSIDELIKSIIDEFEIKPSQPTPKIKHGILNQWIENIVSVKDYENDMAKRLLEIAVLKRMLMPRMGTVDMWVLTPTKKNDKFVAERYPCQMLSFNKDTNLYIGIEEYHIKEGKK